MTKWLSVNVNCISLRVNRQLKAAVATAVQRADAAPAPYRAGAISHAPVRTCVADRVTREKQNAPQDNL